MIENPGMTDDSTAIALLTLRLGDASENAAKPLTPSEYGRLAEWLQANSLSPSDLLAADHPDGLESWGDSRITADRVARLLDRSSAMALQLERWHRAGLWLITRADRDDYPSRLKKRLGSVAPPVLFGSGDRRILIKGGLAVVGSRDIDETHSLIAGKLGRLAAQAGLTVISGLARGVDQWAMRGALGTGGQAVGVLGERLLRHSVDKVWRERIAAGDLVLVSAVDPEAPFSTGTAMGRNKYIYCLADAAVVVHAKDGAGGTWAGAKEAISKAWIPVWVATGHGVEGNQALVNRGALKLPDELTVETVAALESFDAGAEDHQTPASSGPQLTIAESSQPDYQSAQKLAVEDTTQDRDFYVLFCHRALASLASHPLREKQLAEQLDLVPSQVRVWLKRAVEDGLLIKKSGKFTVPEADLGL
jgi:predicted Rossmann fold nucleotide-binding protein DprA/Smf involved in DNA uptake